VADGLPFAYSNLSDRPTGPLLSLARRLLPGFRTVGAQIPAYAEAWRVRNLAALESDKPLWVVLGDSLSQGIGASSIERGWVLQAAAQLRERGFDVRIVNLSVSGARTQDLIERQLPVLDILGIRPAVVSVMIGSNDMIRRRYRDALPARFARLLELVPPGSLIATVPDADHGLARALNESVARAARERDIVGVPFAGGRGMRAEDHFHPNDAGYLAMAGPYVSAIAERLRGGPISRTR
jgi:lysophospholipase L1-like esterase